MQTLQQEPILPGSSNDSHYFQQNRCDEDPQFNSLSGLFHYRQIQFTKKTVIKSRPTLTLATLRIMSQTPYGMALPTASSLVPHVGRQLQ